MIDIPIERLYELGITMEGVLGLTGPEWEQRFAAALEIEVGGPVSDAEFVVQAKRLRKYLDERLARDAARERITEIFEGVADVLAEYNSFVDEVVQTMDEDTPVAVLVKGRIVALFDSLAGVDLRRFDALLGRLLAAHAEAERVAAPHPELGPLLAGGSARIEVMRALHSALVDMRTEQDRDARIAARADARPADAAPPDRRCSDPFCRKPARVGDLCKRHARAAGLLPHGKIGEEL